ncbi:hypothetical protein [Nocardia arizonensis]|uniref:hypothetical protein n=1 Tax=Nocardia arizonensis TaxID=1141647 RepID=UPI0012E1A1DD|nr:hypothetical protein [Nocardia arizonensis]
MTHGIVPATERLVLTAWLPSDLDEPAELHSDPITKQHALPENGKGVLGMVF